MRRLGVSYKEEHEAFVSNLKGTSVGCILSCLLHFPVLVILLKLVQKQSIPIYLRDITYLVIPLLLSLTIFADYATITLIGLFIAELISLQNLQVEFPTPELNEQQIVNERLSCITLFRGGNLLITCISILAVDFRIFPRRYAKTETFGISLMDIGVGTFIVSSALTSHYARGILHYPSKKLSTTTTITSTAINHEANTKNDSNTTTSSSSSSSSSSNSNSSSNGGTKRDNNTDSIAQSHPLSTTTTTRHNNIITSIFHTHSTIIQKLSILSLGIGRLIVLKSVNYHEHLSEYGVHWNFFVTLFCVWTIADFVHYFCPRWMTPWIAFSIIFLYQFMLSYLDLTQYIFTSNRYDFLSMNREGICSVFGFLSLYLLAEHSSYHIFFAPYLKQLRVTSTLTRQDTSPVINKHDISDNSTTTANINTVTPNIGENRSLNHIDNKNNHNCHSSNIDDIKNIQSPTKSIKTDISDMGKSTNDVTDNSTNTDTTVKPSSSSSSTNSSQLKRRISILNFIPWKLLIPAHHKATIRILSVLTVCLWIWWLLSSMLIQPTSRRLSNMTYIFFVWAISMTCLLATLLADVITGEQTITIKTLEYCSRFQLPIFLFANLLTGLINITIPTIYMSPMTGFAILTVYISVVVGFAWLLGTKCSKPTPHSKT